MDEGEIGKVFTMSMESVNMTFGIDEEIVSQIQRMVSKGTDRILI